MLIGEELILDDIPYAKEIVFAILVIVIAYIVNKIVIKKWIEKVADKAGANFDNFKPIVNLLSIFIYIVAIIMILRIFGLEGSLTGLIAGAGFLGIVIGFAMQDVLSNFVSGIILFLDNKFNVGNVVEIAGTIGTVDNILMRTTTIKTWDGEVVIIPNSQVTNEIIKNRSIDKPVIRVKIPIGVEYGTKIDDVITVCEEMLEQYDEIKKEPKPQVAFQEFADSSLNFELRFWVDFTKVNIPDFKTEVSAELQNQLEKSKIGIPFPHVEVLMKK